MIKTNKFKKKYISKYKTINRSKKQYNYTKKLSKKNIFTKQKTLRIILGISPGLQNDATIYKNEFIKQGYKVDLKIIDTIYYKIKEKYYDVNLFLEALPFKFKKLFPSKINVFMPNNELFIDTNGYNANDIKSNKKYTIGMHYDRYEELKNIDFILCKTQICYKFFNFIKNERQNSMKDKYSYKYQTIYTKFTSSIPIPLQDSNSLQDPNLFIHLAGKSNMKNTPELILCWIQNKGFLDIDPDIKLVITCYGNCYKMLNSSLKYWHKYDFKKDPDVSINHKTNIATYKNMTIYFKPIEPLELFNDIISSASVSICISNKEGYGHYINESRYLKKFIITMDYPPMNELVKDINYSLVSNDSSVSNNGGNGILLKKKNKFSIQTYKETKFNFYEAYPDMNELRDSIIWCIKHKNKLSQYGENSRKLFMDDKKYFEDSMKKFIGNKL